MITAHDLAAKNLKGFLANEEALRLYELAKEASAIGPCLEIGSYCGKSAAYLGAGCREAGGILYTIDHHRGSEEQQPGQEYFDPDLLDRETGLIDTFRIFRGTMADLGLEGTVIPLVAPAAAVARAWRTPLGMVFIDGGHTFAAAYGDYSAWASHILPGGFLAIHDIFTDSSRGGQAPHCVYRLAVASGLFFPLPLAGTLAILRRAAPGETTEEALRLWEALNT
jgi:MMP 1-O-methyltransferase